MESIGLGSTVAVLVAVSKNVRHPVRTQLEDAELRAPMNNLLLLPKAINVCLPPPIVLSCDTRVMVLTFSTFNKPCWASVGRERGVPKPATYNVLPLSSPVVAAETGVGALMEGVAKVRACTPAAPPPHSAPQFRMYAVLPSGVNNAETGWS